MPPRKKKKQKRNAAKANRENASSQPAAPTSIFAAAFVKEPKYSLPDPDDHSYGADVRQMLVEGAQEGQVVTTERGVCCECGEVKTEGVCTDEDGAGIACCSNVACEVCEDHVVLKSSGHDPDFWQKRCSGQNFENQFSEEWCRALTRGDLMRMYKSQYSDPEKCMHTLPAGANAVANRLVNAMCRCGSRCHIHDPRRVAPLLAHVREIEKALLADADADADHDMDNGNSDDATVAGGHSVRGPAFELMVGLLLALDVSRGDSGWAFVEAMVVEDMGGLMLTSMACVMLNLTVDAADKDAVAAFASALYLRRNLTMGVGDLPAEAEEMKAHLEALEQGHVATGVAGGVPTAGAGVCALSQLTSSLGAFAAEHRYLEE